MAAPRVSVAVATYDQAAFLADALESLRAQTLPSDEFEVIVINDGSTDGTAEILERYHPWARIVSRENRGLVASCNEALALARGAYFARVDSDDLVEPDWLASLVPALDADAGAVAAVADRFEGVPGAWRAVAAPPSDLYSLVACGSVMRTSALRAVGGFRPVYWEEYDLYLRLASAGTFIHVPRPLYRYRRHAHSMTAVAERRVAGWRELADLWGADRLRAAGKHEELERVLAERRI